MASSALVLPSTAAARWNDTRADYPRQCTVGDLVDAQAARQPNAIAVQFRGDRLSYRQLQERVEQVARALVRRGVRHGSLVGACLERSPDMIVALLAVLRAGAAYVPLDPAYPRARVQFVLEDAGVEFVVTQQSLLHLSEGLVPVAVCLDEDGRSIDLEDRAPLAGSAGPGDLAYVIYTSGSTGTPKGVQVTHRNLVNFLWSMRSVPGFGPQDVVLAITTISFDIAVLEMFLPLVVGARVVVVERRVASDGRLLADAIERAGATVVQATPATWRLLLEAGWHGAPHLKALCGGEALPRDLADRLLARCESLWNMYGPTETTVWSAVHRVTPGQGPVPIGRPIANTQIHVFDERGAEAPSGAEGEIFIGGDGVASGYLKRPQLTAERFVPDPFASAAGARLYKTGDIGRRQLDGSIVFAGRADHQVKIRGYRVELEEIEAVLGTHPQIRHSVVVAVDDPSGEKRLAAYYVTHDGNPVASRQLRRFLADRVPDYLIPSTFAYLQSMPLTPNGKIDRRALPAAATPCAREIVAPRDSVERELVSIWERALDVAPIGVTDDFFDLGGHSLVALQVFADIRGRLGRELPLSTLVAAPTIEVIARIIREDGGEEHETLVPIQPHGAQRPLFVVHGGAGTVLFLRDLARYLGTDQPLFGLQSEGLDGFRVTMPSVEEMAARYLSAIRTVQPRGPYLLAGYCFGGIVAFEMAQQLRQQNGRADLVALFNAPNRAVLTEEIERRGRPRADQGCISGHRARLARLSLLAKAGYLREATVVAARWRWGALRDRRARLRWAARQILARVYLSGGRTIPRHLRDAYVLDVTTRAETSYVPGKYPGRLVIFRGKGLYEDPCLGWEGRAAEIETVEVAGTHRFRRDLFREPVVQLLAGELKRYLRG